jgi:hypothetical protein
MASRIPLFHRLARRRAVGLLGAFVAAATAASAATGGVAHSAQQTPAVDVDCPTVACSSKKDALFAGMRATRAASGACASSTSISWSSAVALIEEY